MKPHALLTALIVVILPVRAGAELYDLVATSAVEVFVDGRQAGSGWIANRDGLIVTAAHMVWDAGKRKVEVTGASLGRLPATIVAVDRGHDLALLQVAAGRKPYPALAIAVGAPDVLMEVFLFGTPMFRHELLLSGKVARVTPAYEYVASMACYARIYYISGPSPQGSSGGCWVDARGRVVGNQSGYISTDGKSVGVAYVAPPSAIRRLVQTRRAPVTAEMGVVIEELMEKPVEFIRRFPPGTAGVLLVKVLDKSTAQEAGLKPDMVVVGLGGQALTRRDEFFDRVRLQKPGDTVTLRVLEPDKPAVREMPVKLGVLD